MLRASPTILINSLANEKRARGERVYNLSVGEARLPTPDVVIEAALAAMKAGKTGYPPVQGVPELRAAATDWMNSRYGTTYQTSECLISCGGKFTLFALIQTLIRPGDECLLVAPYWTSYDGILELFGGKMVAVATEETGNWKLEIRDLDKIVTERTKIFIFNNATNPTGVVYTRNEIEEILAWAKQRNIFVISDEVYSGLVYTSDPFVSCGAFADHRDNVAVIQSCSKHFAMTGWRVGMLFASQKLVAAVNAIQSQSTSGTSTISQWAALAAIEHADEIMPVVRAAVQKRRDAFVSAFEKNFGTKISVPSSGLYGFIPMHAFGVEEIDSEKFCTAALRDANVAMVPGTAFGMDGYVRCSFGEPEAELEASVAALAEWVRTRYNR